MTDVVDDRDAQKAAAGYRTGWGLWGRWIVANALGEAVGLGLAALLGAALGLAIERTYGSFAGVIMAVVLIIAGTFEGVVVGLAQSWVLRGAVERLSVSRWVLMTGLGAFVAWVLGMLPSTLMDMGTPGATAVPAADVPDAVMYVMAAGLGFVAGPILGFFQWTALRAHVRRAGWWLLANALAWMVGMPLVFMVAGSAPPAGITAGYAAFVLLMILATGALVGAVHGGFLVWLLRKHSR
ncbi:MAG: hypothetical protein Kow00124_31840 [Anaerolineae bacterium]